LAVSGISSGEQVQVAHGGSLSRLSVYIVQRWVSLSRGLLQSRKTLIALKGASLQVRDLRVNCRHRQVMDLARAVVKRM
jgi:hypothetical protein